MQPLIGLAFAFATLLSWAAGDFFIQRSSREIGIWKSLFAISLVGTIVPLPFLWNNLPSIWSSVNGFVLLLTLGAVILFAALFEFAALERGKLAVIEPLFGLEIPFTLGIAVSLGVDHISPVQSALVLLISVGVILVALEGKRGRSRSILEKGVLLAGLGAATMALSDFLTGIGSRAIDPFATIWFINIFLTIISLGYLLYAGSVRFGKDLKKYWRAILGESVFDNIAWFCYALSMIYLPISIATAITQSYIVLTTLLGIAINHERLSVAQKLGVALTTFAVLLLSLSVQN